MTNRQKIAIDVMGGDFGPKIVIPAANIALQKHESSLEFVLVGDEGEINTHLNNYPELKKVSKIIHTDQVIANDEKPSTALRSGKKSSMRLAIDAVKNGDAESIVSAGNTGALMATAKLVLKCLPACYR
jgi:glycerol-3-phosphate acyltransferase PlsX